jgi:hypothetical protein
MRTIQRVGLAVVCLLVFAAPAVPQKAAKPGQSGDVRGVVNYCRPDRVNGTLVHIPGRSFQAKLGPSGEFVLNYVPAGTYSLVVEIPGSPAHTVPGVSARDGEITDVGQITICNDSDGDGVTEDVDCDDNNAAIGPGAVEGCSGGGCVGCDGVDNNCNGVVDEGCPNCTDADGDGFCAQQACSGVSTASVTCLLGVDCNDSNGTIRPNAAELCDGVDNNCNGAVDEGIDLSSDPLNCGACGRSCWGPNVREAACVRGTCQVECNGTWGDCNGDPSDGCEEDISYSRYNCGACGHVCRDSEWCQQGTCLPN